MNQTVEKATNTIVPDWIVKNAIDYLDSATDYRECLPADSRTRTSARHAARKRTNDVEDFLLVFAPFLVIAIAIIAVFSK